MLGPNANLTALLDASPDHIFELDLEGRFRYVNSAARAVLCAASELARSHPASIVGKTMAELKLDEGFRTRFMAAAAIAASGTSVTSETLFPTAEGPRHFEYILSPIRMSDGSIEGICGIARDIETRTVLKNELEAVQARLRAFFENAPAIVCMLTGPDHVFEMINPLYQQVVGPNRSIVGLPVKTALPEVVEQGVTALLDGVYRTGKPYIGREVPVQLARKSDGPPDERWFTFVYQPRRNAANETEGIDVFGFEVTDQVSARKQAEAAEQNHRFLAEAIPQQVWTSGPEGKLDFVNRRVLSYFNRPEAEVLGLGWQDVIHPEDRALCLERWSNALQTGTEYEVEFRLRRADGCYRWHLARAIPFRSTAGQIVRWFGTNTDIDEKRNAIADLHQRAKFEQQLIGIVSHDLRNPIAAIAISASMLLRQENPDERTAKGARRIKSSADRAERMIHDLLDLTQVRHTGRLPINALPAELHELARDAIDEIRSSHPGREILLEASGDTTGVWDADRLAQLLGNLLGNAVQYGAPEAPIQVRLRGEVDAVELEVANTGAPIPESVVLKLFNPFERGVEPDDQLNRSIGLGLFIVKQIAVAHGGDVTAQSNSQRTAFKVRLPRHVPKDVRT